MSGHGKGRPLATTNKAAAGFTLVEMLDVLVIISLMLALVGTSISRKRQSGAKDITWSLWQKGPSHMVVSINPKAKSWARWSDWAVLVILLRSKKVQISSDKDCITENNICNIVAPGMKEPCHVPADCFFILPFFFNNNCSIAFNGQTLLPVMSPPISEG